MNGPGSWRIAGALAILTTVAPAAAPAQVAPPVQCLSRETNTDLSLLPNDKTLSIFVSVPEQAQANVQADGWSNGSTSGTFAVQIMQDGLLIARSDLQRGSEVQRAGVSTSLTLYPGRQYKITAKPGGRDGAVRYMRLRVGIGGTC